MISLPYIVPPRTLVCECRKKEKIITMITILVKVHRVHVYLWRKRVKMLIITGRGQGNVFHICRHVKL